jgi:transketolase
MDHRTYAICSDGDLMEGVASEAASLAGHLGLGRLVYLYDDNSVSLDGPANLSFSEDVPGRFRAYGWHTLTVDDANDLDALRAAIAEGIAENERPTLIAVRSIIGWPAPHVQGTSEAHGKALGEDEVRATKEILGWDPDAHFLVPDGVYEHFSAVERGEASQREWQERFDAWHAGHAELAEAWDAAWSSPAKPLPGLDGALPDFADTEKIATRSAGGKVMAAVEPFTPTMVGGAADLSESTKTLFPGEGDSTKARLARNIRFGVREHGMGAAVNGMAGHGGMLRPYGSTFLQFADYMRGSIRLSALMGLEVAWVFTHDSVALGEDGPTHQPVEHLAALRAIPHLTVIRPADARETAEAWRVMLEELEGPAALILSRQDLPVLEGPAAVGRGAYVLRDSDGDADVVLVGTGAEVSTALEGAEELKGAGVSVRVVSMPSWELFAAQEQSYRDEVLPPGVPKVSVEAAISMGWERWVDRSVSIERFGASAPGTEVLERLGITGEHVAAVARELLGR